MDSGRLPSWLSKSLRTPRTRPRSPGTAKRPRSPGTAKTPRSPGTAKTPENTKANSPPTKRPRRAAAAATNFKKMFETPRITSERIATYEGATNKQRRLFKKRKNTSTSFHAWLQKRKSAKPKKIQAKVLTAQQKRMNQMVPWLVCDISGTDVSIDEEPILVETFSDTYRAVWSTIDIKTLGAAIFKNNMSKGLPRLYVGNAPNFIFNRHRTLKKYNNLTETVTDTLSRQRLRLNKPDTTKSGLLKFNRSGAEVAEVKSIIESSPQDINSVLDLLSYKLIGDRLTILTCKKVNKDRKGIIKPFDYEIGKMIVDTFYSGNNVENGRALEGLSRELSRILKRDNRTLDILFESAIVFTGDRPAFLYSFIEKQPCILVLPKDNTREDTTYYYIPKQENLRVEVKDSILNDILTESNSNTQKVKIALLDSLHDFGKSQTGLFDFLMKNETGIFREVFKNNPNIKPFLDKITKFADVNRSQNAIVTELIPKLPGVDTYMKTNQVHMSNMKERFKNDALIYDAGDFPPELRPFRAKGLARLLNAGSAQPEILGGLQ